MAKFRKRQSGETLTAYLKAKQGFEGAGSSVDLGNQSIQIPVEKPTTTSALAPVSSGIQLASGSQSGQIVQHPNAPIGWGKHPITGKMAKITTPAPVSQYSNQIYKKGNLEIPVGQSQYGIHTAEDLQAQGFTASQATPAPKKYVADTVDSVSKMSGEVAPAGAISDVRQDILDTMSDLAGIRTDFTDTIAGVGVSAEEAKANLTEINQKIADIRVAWRDREKAIKSEAVEMSVQNKRLLSESKEVNAQLADLAIQKSVAQNDWEMAYNMSKENASNIYKGKELELKRLEVQLGFLDADEKKALAEAKENLTFERRMATEGYVHIKSPAGLDGLTEKDILRIPTDSGIDKIYRIPPEEEDKNIDTRIETVNGQRQMITYNKKTGSILKKTNLGGAYKDSVGGGSSGVGFTNTEKKKLEAAGLSNASREEQLAHLYGEGTEESDWDYGESIIEANPNASDEEMKKQLLQHTNLSVSEVNALIANRPQQDFKVALKNAVQSLLDNGLSRSEAKKYIINEYTDGGKIDLPKTHKDAIEDALVDFYGRTFWQKAIPGGR